VDAPFVPFRQLVLKVHSRCDLACDHCYVYEHRDQSWRNRPMVMSQETVAWTAARLAEHAKTHRLNRVSVVLHGGEPLLAGPDRLRQVARTLREALSGVCDLDLRIHTNGILLDESYCRLFSDEDIKIGISVDGYQEAHDRHRRYANGRGSYQQVIKAVELLRTEPHRENYAGLLCTIDIANNPVAVYDALLALDPPQIDFLLPHATWDNPPDKPPGGGTAYADWLLAIFGRWLATDRPVSIRLFNSIISTTLGGTSRTEAAGLEPSDLVVVETDGTYEQADSLKTAFDGAPATGFDVVHHDLDLVAQHPAIGARQRGLTGLCDTCQACPVVTSCGGGLYAHRYRSGSGFENPSVYCEDLKKLITGIRHAMWPATATGQGVAIKSATRQHAIPDAELGELATGFGGSDALEHLQRGQRSLRRALVAAVHDAAASLVPGAHTASVQEGWRLLTRAEASHPQAVDAVLGHPYIRVWAAHCLERLRNTPPGHTPQTRSLSADVGHLAGIAMAAAIRGGLSAQIPVPLRDGFVYLPSLGRFAAPGADPADTAMVESQPGSEGTFTIAVGDGKWTVTPSFGDPDPTGRGDNGPRWEDVRRLAAHGLSVALEDADPFRDCHHWPATPRLDGQMASRWETQFAMAWDLIQRQHSTYAPGLKAGLSTIMPLAGSDAGTDVSATARHAFGAVAAALPRDHATLALLLIHEFQHVKLGAVMDMFDLFDAADQRLFQVAWRDDPRPVEGVLQGTYAHVAVTDFWRIRRHTTGGSAALAAQAHFARWRAATAEATETLAGCGALTPLGQRFVEGMQETIAPWLTEPVSVPAAGLP
jgi:uncharacterized protein